MVRKLIFGQWNGPCTRGFGVHIEGSPCQQLVHHADATCSFHSHDTLRVPSTCSRALHGTLILIRPSFGFLESCHSSPGHTYTSSGIFEKVH